MKKWFCTLFCKASALALEIFRPIITYIDFGDSLSLDTTKTHYFSIRKVMCPDDLTYRNYAASTTRIIFYSK